MMKKRKEPEVKKISDLKDKLEAREFKVRKASSVFYILACFLHLGMACFPWFILPVWKLLP